MLVLLSASCSAFEREPIDYPTPIGGDRTRITGNVVGVPRCTYSEPPCQSPITSMQAQVNLVGARSYRAPTAADGTFSIDVDPGDYHITFAALDHEDARCPKMNYELSVGYLVPLGDVECTIYGAAWQR